MMLEAQRRKEEEEERRFEQQNRWQQQGLCRHCGGTFSGFFSKTCKSCGKAKDY